MKTYVGVEVEFQSFFISDAHRGKCSVCGRGSPGKGHKVRNVLGIGWAELKSGENEHFCAAQVQP